MMMIIIIIIMSAFVKRKINGPQMCYIVALAYRKFSVSAQMSELSRKTVSKLLVDCSKYLTILTKLCCFKHGNRILLTLLKMLQPLTVLSVSSVTSTKGKHLYS